MRKGVEVRLRPGDRERLEAVISGRRSPQHHVWRARIVLMTAAGAGTMTIRSVTGKRKPTIWRWQERYMSDGPSAISSGFTSTRPSMRSRSTAPNRAADEEGSWGDDDP